MKEFLVKSSDRMADLSITWEIGFLVHNHQVLLSHTLYTNCKFVVI